MPVRTALKFGKQTASFQFYHLKFDTYIIKFVSFGIIYFPLSFSDYLDHSLNRLEYRNSVSVPNNQKTLTENC